MKSIRQKLLVYFLGLAGAAALICGAVGIAMSYSSSQSTLQQSMTTIATLTSDRVSYQLQSYKNAAEAFGMVPKLSDPNATVEDKKALLDSWVEHYGMMRGNVFLRAALSLKQEPLLPVQTCLAGCVILPGLIQPKAGSQKGRNPL